MPTKFINPVSPYLCRWTSKSFTVELSSDLNEEMKGDIRNVLERWFQFCKEPEAERFTITEGELRCKPNASIWLRDVADTLDRAERTGANVDEPEGERVITMSDTLARKIAEGLREAANAVQDEHLHSNAVTPGSDLSADALYEALDRCRAAQGRPLSLLEGWAKAATVSPKPRVPPAEPLGE